MKIWEEKRGYKRKKEKQKKKRMCEVNVSGEEKDRRRRGPQKIKEG